jgi:aerobic-type carbon monoxide dehydrogenase small subunit (CoxS/CutS family)
VILFLSLQLSQNGCIFNRGNRKFTGGHARQLVWVLDDSHVVFGKKVSSEKGSVSRCVVLVDEPVLLSPKFGTKSSRFFTQEP